jgi:hypothetical protein
VEGFMQSVKQSFEKGFVNEECLVEQSFVLHILPRDRGHQSTDFLACRSQEKLYQVAILIIICCCGIRMEISSVTPRMHTRRRLADK